MVNGDEFIRRLRKVGRRRGIEVHFDPDGGKGSHGKLYFGNRRAVIPDRRKELRPGTLRAILAQLGLTRDDLE